MLELLLLLDDCELWLLLDVLTDDTSLWLLDDVLNELGDDDELLDVMSTDASRPMIRYRHGTIPIPPA